VRRRVGQLARILAQRLAAERGFTIIEALLAIVVMSVGLLAAVSVLETAGRTAYSAERQEQYVAFGQREMERLRTLRFDDLALSVLPSHESSGSAPGDNNPANPDFYVLDNGGARTLQIKDNYANSGSAAIPGTDANGEPLISGGVVASGEAFSVAGTQGTVYRYISQRTETCTNCTAGDSKRITLAIVPEGADNGAGPKKPIWLTTIVNDPDARPPNTQAPNSTQAAVTAQPFFLHDVSCRVGYGLGLDANQRPAPHATHNTSEALKTCADADAPDSMSNVAPVADGLGLQNYSEDLERGSPAGGLVLKRYGATCPTDYTAAEAPNLKQSIHTWATPAFASTFSTSTGTVRSAFSFWTQNVEAAGGDGELCVTLRRTGSATPLATSVYSLPDWPRAPTQLSFAFDHAQFSVPAGQRLLLTVSAKSSSDNDIALMYDHPDYNAVLTVPTTTPVP